MQSLHIFWPVQYAHPKPHKAFRLFRIYIPAKVYTLSVFRRQADPEK